MHTENPNCGCQETTTTYTHCNQCAPQESCDCPVVDLSTDCILFKDDDIQCESVTVITKNVNLTTNLKNLVSYICGRFSEIQNYFRIINIGIGAKVYKSNNLLGEKQLRTITQSGDFIVVDENTNDISISVDEDILTEFVESLIPASSNPALQNVLDVGGVAILGVEATGKNEYRMTNDGLESYYTRQTAPSVFNFSTIRVQDFIAMLDSGSTTGNRGRFSIDSGITTFFQGISNTIKTTVGFNTPSVATFLNFPAKSSPGTYEIATTDLIPVVDGSETKINAGTNITITGTGTSATPYVVNASMTPTVINSGTNISISGAGTSGNPYIINSTASGTPTVINAGTNISVTGTGTIGTPYVISNTLVVDGTETKINSGVTTTVTGNGTISTPYILETVNLQKLITADYLLLASDNNYSMKVNNGATPVTITVPTGLPENFFVGITQKGTADVTIAGSGTTITNPIGLKIKGQGYCVGLEQIGSSNAFDLLADTKA